jgi:hypothetical protein
MENLLVKCARAQRETKTSFFLCSDGVMQFCVYIENTNHLRGDEGEGKMYKGGSCREGLKAAVGKIKVSRCEIGNFMI